MSVETPGTTSQNIPEGFVRVESKLDGITVFAPAPPVEQNTEGANPGGLVNFKCPNCGATTAFDPRAGSVTCSNCGSVYALHAQQVGRKAGEFEFTLDTLQSTPRGWGLTRRDLVCENCGASTSVAPTELATTCPFCGSNRVSARTAVPDKFRPRFLVPFKIEREECAARGQEWLARGWFYPRDLVSAARGAQFTGVYLSFWTFHANVNAQWRAEVGTEREERYFDVNQAKFKTRIVVEWNWRQGSVSVPFENQLGTATTHISARLLQRLEPYQLEALVTYEPGFLAGWRAVSYEISLNDAWDAARAQMRERTRQTANEDIDSKYVRNFSMNAAFDDEAWRLILLPVYITSYRFRDKTYQLVINGQTGKVAGDKPIDWQKVLLVVAALVTPGVLIAGAGVALAQSDLGWLFLVGGFIFVIGALVAAYLLQQVTRAGAE